MGNGEEDKEEKKEEKEEKETEKEKNTYLSYPLGVMSFCRSVTFCIDLAKGYTALAWDAAAVFSSLS